MYPERAYIFRGSCKTIASIKKETFRSDKTAFWPDISEKQIAERMWEAQIKVVFPIIEKQRSIIVERYRKGIEALLPITGAYGEMFYDARMWKLASCLI